jgi:hypothetical protein
VFGCGTFLKELIPIEAGAAIVFYIGIIITAQAFQTTPREHAPAVAISLFPALAALLALKFQALMIDANATTTIAELISNPSPDAQVPEISGLLALFGANAGWLVSALILTAIGVAFIEKRYKVAAIWSGAATVLTLIGLLHSYRVEGNVIREFFIWQPAPVVSVEAEASAMGPAEADPPAGIAQATTPTDERAETSPAATRPAVAATQPAKPTFSYRAYPLAVGYALATLVFALAAINTRKRERVAAAVEPGESKPPTGPLPTPGGEPPSASSG